MKDKIESAEKVMNIVSNNGLATVIAVVFVGFMIYTNVTLNNRLNRNTEVLVEFNATLQGINKNMDNMDKRLEKIEDRSK